jgi:neutral amino acid transport system permease protein
VPTLRRVLLVLAFALLGTSLLAPVGASATVDGDPVAQSSSEVRGRIRGDDGPVADVAISIEQDGAAVGSTTTDEDGNWSGTYTVVVDTTTLPEGLTVREERFASQEVEVAEGESKAVLVPLVAGEGGGVIGATNTARFLNLVVSGIKLGAIIAITSVGLSLIFGVTGLVNFAHGELVAIGAVVAYWLHVGPNGARMPLIAAGVLAVIAGAAAGGLLERGMFRPLRRRKTGLISLLVITIGLSFFIRHLILVVYGAGANKYIDYAVQRDLVRVGPVAIAPRDLVTTLIALAVLGGVGLMLQRTKLGTAMRAVADNKDLAESSGIDVKRVILAVWILGGGLAAMGGVMQGLVVGGVQWDMGFRLLLLMFAGVIVGGIGTAYGAMVGGLLVGVTSEVSTFWFSVDLKLVFAFLILIVVLLFRPQGLLGKKERFG